MSTGLTIPITVEFTENKQASAETAIWMLGDSAYGILDWHDPAVSMRSCQSLHTTRETPTIDSISSYRIEDLIQHHSENVRLNHNRRMQVERTNEACKDCGLRTLLARGHVHARPQVFFSLCLRLVLAIINYEQGDNPRSNIVRV